ncbi:hypothetical protein Ddc_02252 [Ditylenchus destructor]|nr:hypothetical protein Ddc_02252 [Ditylenchus destructor]
MESASKQKMDEWIEAFKIIYKRVPTKKDFREAPKEIRGIALPESQAPAQKKRRRLSMKKLDGDFDSPQKVTPNRRIRSENQENVPVSPFPIPSTSNFELRRPDPKDLVALSPVKKIPRLHRDEFQSPSTAVAELLDPSVLKTPSPRKMLRKMVTLTNAEHLLLSPEKGCSPSKYHEMCPLGSEDPSALLQSENEKEMKQVKKASVKRPRKSSSANYVRINLKNKKFAPRHKTNFKKKWFKKKFGK